MTNNLFLSHVFTASWMSICRTFNKKSGYKSKPKYKKPKYKKDRFKKRKGGK